VPNPVPRELPIAGDSAPIVGLAFEEAARAAEYERLKLMADNAPVLLAYCDREHRYRYVNAAYSVRFAQTPDQLIGKTVEDLLGPELWHRIQPYRDHVLKGDPVEYEVAVEREAGVLQHMRCLLNPARDAAGDVVGYVLAIHDVTAHKALKRSEEALRESDRHKDEFLSVLAHELRNPLAPLTNALELLRRAAARDPELQRTRDMMERQLNQLVRIVDDLLDVSRISRGRLELRKAPMPLALAVESALESCHSLFCSRGHEITLNLSPEPLLVEGDFARLAQVFVNLLSNSAKYTDRGGKIRVSLEREADHALVSVRDSGVGIPSDALASVFDMFSQIQSHKRLAAGGLGIGLALVRSLVQMHGGSVEAHSEGPGTGSVFTVRLPLIREATAEAETPKGDDVVAQKKRRILVADDNVDAAATLALLLQMQGHETRTATDGRQAVELAATFRPDIIFMDVGMPRVDGLEATRQIRAQPWGKSIVIVALTGWGQPGDRQQTQLVGMNLHLVKPINLEGIAAVLAHA
jgi:PAS domain S-box-containing protein